MFCKICVWYKQQQFVWTEIHCQSKWKNKIDDQIAILLLDSGARKAKETKLRYESRKMVRGTTSGAETFASRNILRFSRILAVFPIVYDFENLKSSYS